MAGLNPESSPLFAKMKQSVEMFESEEEERNHQEQADASGEGISLEEHGWEEHYDEQTQAPFYHSPRTGETRWERPTGADLEAPQEVMYYYQGTAGEVNGPQPLLNMQEWFAHGYFAHGTMVRQGEHGPFTEVHGFAEICGIHAELVEGEEGEEGDPDSGRSDASASNPLAADQNPAEGLPPLGRSSLEGRLQVVAASIDLEPEPEPEPELKLKLEPAAAALEHVTVGRAKHQSGAPPSRTQRRRRSDDGASRLSDANARVSALEAELEAQRASSADEKLQLETELMRLERAAAKASASAGAVNARQPCVAVFYEEAPGRPSAAVPVAQAAALVISAAIVDGTKVWAEGMSEWRPFREMKTQLGLDDVEAAAVAATFFYEVNRSGEMSTETPTKELTTLLSTASAVNRATKVWTEGMDAWKPLGEVEHMLMPSSD